MSLCALQTRAATAGARAPIVPRISVLQPPRAHVMCGASGRRGGEQERLVASEPHEIGRFVEEAAASSHGLFNEGFKAALSGALERQGPDALLQGSETKVDEYQLSGQEELLKAAIIAARSNLMKLKMVQAEVDKAVEVEARQVERLEFALRKARNDAAYYRGIMSIADSDAD